MPGWTADELQRIGGAEELEIAARREDGTLRPWVPIWVVRVGDELFIRSYRGRSAGWFRHALQRHEARIRSGGVERDVSVDEPADDGLHARIDEAYRSKYARHDDAYVSPMVVPTARAATFRLLAR